MIRRENWAGYVQRVSSGVSRKDVAHAAGIHPSGLRWFETKRPSPEKAIAFARHLHQQPIEALIAGGYLEPHEAAGVIEVVRSRKELSDAELLLELGKRLAERPARSEVDDITARLARPEDNGERV
ncbi:MAG: helix-turn-helix domain-containing protein [Mycobacterium sp.]